MTANNLHAFFELDIAPPGFNILPFLVLADIERERQGLEHIHMVVVPGTSDGFRDLDFQYAVYNKEWRKRQIVISSAPLLPTLNGLTVCATRDEAAHVETVIAKHIFPRDYSVSKPSAHHKHIYLMEAYAEGFRVDRLVSTGQPRIYARQWLDGVAQGRKVISISLRESTYDIHRNSNLANWGDFGRWLETEGYCPVVVRDTEAEAWDAAEDLLSQAQVVVEQQRQAAFTGTAMVGQRAQSRSYEEHRVGERLWNGISTVRVNCGTAIVGNPQQVADELMAYWRLGIDEFILSGYPHVEEAERVAQTVLPLVKTAADKER